MFDLHGDFDDRTRAVGADLGDFILLIRQQNNGPVDFVLTDGIGGKIDWVIHSVDGAPINAHGVIGKCGPVAMSWNQPFKPPQIAVTQFVDDVTIYDAPPDTLGVQLLGVSDTGLIWGAWLTPDYQMRPFVASAFTPPQLVDHAIIGYPTLTFSGPIAADADWSLLWSFAGTNFNASLHLTPAGEGDVNGDGTCGTDDLLAVLSAWGPHSPKAACGPDLDLDGSVDIEDVLIVIANWSTS